MKKINQKDIQKIEFEILKQFKIFCKENKLNFFLVGGTLLGAVRHEGFIPWDDDIDVGMVRNEFDKFIELINKNPYIDQNKRYKVLRPIIDHPYPYTKIIDTDTVAYEKFLNKKYATGLWMDIFPFDYGANNREEIVNLAKKHKFYKLFYKVGVSGELPLGKKILKAIAYPVYSLLTRGDCTYWTKKMIDLKSDKKTKFFGDVVWLNCERDIYPAEWFGKMTELTFEGEKFPVQKEYKKYLSQYYGDYMKLPDEKDRVFHGFECYYLDKKKDNVK